MRTAIILMISVALGVAAGWATAWWRVDGGLEREAGDAARPGSTDTADGHAHDTPRVEIDRAEFDFGRMDVNAEGEHAFTFTNVGDAPLKLEVGDTSCSCTLGQIDDDHLAPGESTPVIVRWHANAGAGPYRQTATVHTNDPQRPRVVLTVTGEMIEALSADPSSLVFSRVAAGEPAVAETRLESTVSDDLEIVGHQMLNHRTAEFFEVETASIPAAELDSPATQSVVRVRVKVKPGLPLGRFQQTIELQTNLPEAPSFELEVTGRVTGPVTVVGVGPGWNGPENLLDLGKVDAQTGTRRKLLLIARGQSDKPIEYTVERIIPDWLEVELGEPKHIGRGATTQTPLWIAVPAGSPATSYLGAAEAGHEGEVRLKTNRPKAEEIPIRVRFAVVEKQ